MVSNTNNINLLDRGLTTSVCGMFIVFVSFGMDACIENAGDDV
jgi:Na+-transporting methylmalonyl-CoA/oxaloacetate decarboxylase gamma subunit